MTATPSSSVPVISVSVKHSSFSIKLLTSDGGWSLVYISDKRASANISLTYLSYQQHVAQGILLVICYAPLTHPVCGGGKGYRGTLWVQELNLLFTSEQEKAWRASVQRVGYFILSILILNHRFQ